MTVTDLPLQVTLTDDPPASVEEGANATVRLTLVGPVVDPAPASVTIAVRATSGSAVVTVGGRRRSEGSGAA